MQLYLGARSVFRTYSEGPLQVCASCGGLVVCTTDGYLHCAYFIFEGVLVGWLLLGALRGMVTCLGFYCLSVPFRCTRPVATLVVSTTDGYLHCAYFIFEGVLVGWLLLGTLRGMVTCWVFFLLCVHVQ